MELKGSLRKKSSLATIAERYGNRHIVVTPALNGVIMTYELGWGDQDRESGDKHGTESHQDRDGNLHPLAHLQTPHNEHRKDSKQKIRSSKD